MTIQEPNETLERTEDHKTTPESNEISEVVSGEVTESADDDFTVIILNETDEGGNNEPDLSWIEQPGTERETHRRNVLLRELRRVQRTSFIHFLVLCFIPLALLVVVLVTVAGGDEECFSDAAVCELEPRTFINAFTTRCVCDAIAVERPSE